MFKMQQNVLIGGKVECHTATTNEDDKEGYERKPDEQPGTTAQKQQENDPREKNQLVVFVLHVLPEYKCRANSCDDHRVCDSNVG